MWRICVHNQRVKEGMERQANCYIESLAIDHVNSQMWFQSANAGCQAVELIVFFQFGQRVLRQDELDSSTSPKRALPLTQSHTEPSPIGASGSSQIN